MMWPETKKMGIRDGEKFCLYIRCNFSSVTWEFSRTVRYSGQGNSHGSPRAVSKFFPKSDRVLDWGGEKLNKIGVGKMDMTYTELITGGIFPPMFS